MDRCVGLRSWTTRACQMSADVTPPLATATISFVMNLTYQSTYHFFAIEFIELLFALALRIQIGRTALFSKLETNSSALDMKHAWGGWFK